MSFEGLAFATANGAGSPKAFLAAVILVIVWAATGPWFHYADTWQLVINTGTTIVTFLMVFLIQASQNRDTAAINAKLDEIIHALTNARNELIRVEKQPIDVIEELRP